MIISTVCTRAVSDENVLRRFVCDVDAKTVPATDSVYFKTTRLSQ